MALAIPVRIDRGSPMPLYHQLAVQLTAAIEDGTLKPGDPFENELAIADRLDLSRPTVRRAIGELVQRGLLVRRRGIGTVVANQVFHRKDKLSSLYDDLTSGGRRPTTEVLAFDTEAQDAEAADFFCVDPDEPLVFLSRLRLADGQPLAILNNWLGPECADLEADRFVGTGLYAVLRELGVRPAVAHQKIGARRATAGERRRLGIGTGVPLLTMTRRAYDADGRPVELGDHAYRADQYAVDITVHET